MARTSLLNRLTQWARDIAEAEHSGIPVTQLREERTGQVSRRRLIQGTGTAVLAATAASLPAPARAADQQTGPRIAIVGAWIAGLTAARVLADNGIASTVYEASERIGGRMHSNTSTWQNGQTTEWCGELIDTGHVLIRGLARRFGLALIDRVAAAPPAAEPTNFIFNSYYPESQAIADFVPVYQTLLAQITATGGSTTYNSHNANGYALDHLSLSAWIDQYVPGGHGSYLGQLLDIAYNEEYGLDTPLQSSLNLVYLLGYQPASTGFSIFGQSDERFSIRGGNQQLPVAMAHSLPKGTVNPGWRLVAIAQSSTGSVTLTFDTAGGTRVVTADGVILTLPFAVLRTIDYRKAGFDALKQTAIRDLGYGTNSKLSLQFDSRYWNQTGPWPGIANGETFSDVGYMNTWETTIGQAGGTGIIVDYTGGSIGAALKAPTPYSSSAESPLVAAYARKFLAKLELVWPGVSAHYNGRAALSYPTGDPNLRGSYSCWLVGQYTKFSGYERVRQGNIYFAGEHTSLSFQGYMEGGAETGAAAAAQVLKANGIAPNRSVAAMLGR